MLHADFTARRISCAFAVALLMMDGGSSVLAAGVDDSLRSLVIHKHDDDFFSAGSDISGGSACQRLAGLAEMGPQNRQFLEVFPLSGIAAVEVRGDEITLPTALVVHILAQGRFEAIKHPINVGRAAVGMLRLRGGKCMQFNVLLDPADGQVNSVQTDMGSITVPDVSAPCRVFMPQAKPGMTRTEVEKQLQPDGGESMPFRYERYVMPNSACGPKGEVIKINLAFKPAGMSDNIYHLGKWIAPRTNSQDIVMRISPRYLEHAFFD